nr:hypothetical protein [Tanacetum cinerariifolium]
MSSVEILPLLSIAQSSVLPRVADEPASPLRDVSQRKACPTDSGFIADQDRATIAKSSTLPHESALRVTSPSADEGTQEVEINRLKARVKLLEDREGEGAERFEDDAPIKGRNLDEGEAADERVSDDTEEMATVLTSMDATTVLASGVAGVPTGSGSIPTASPPAVEVPIGSDVVPTASLVFATATVVTPYRKRKGKEVMVEFETPKKQKVQEQIDAQVAKELEEQLEREDQRMSEQIARDAEVPRIHVEEELQSMIDGLDMSNKIVAKYLQEYQQFASELPLERRIELISDFVRYKTTMPRFTNSRLNKERHERFKRKGTTFEQESTKKLKTSEEVPKEVKSPDEVLEEKVKEMMQLVPIEEVYVEPLQVKHLIFDWKVHTKGKRSYWKITRLGGSSASRDKEIFMLVEKDYPLRKGLAIILISYKLQVENYSRMANDLILKIFKIASTPRQQ